MREGTGRRLLLAGVMAFCAGQVARGQALPLVITPSDQAQSGGASARRDRSGAYWFDTEINGATLPMVFDSGATVVTLRAEDAAKAGIDTDALSYTLHGMTANGPARFAPVMLPALTVGNITRTRVLAAVAKPGTLDSNLLGQSFLSRIKGFRQEGTRLVLLDGQ